MRSFNVCRTLFPADLNCSKAHYTKTLSVVSVHSMPTFLMHVGYHVVLGRLL